MFLDIDRLRAGKFDENLLLSIQMSSHFVLILTPDALDRCLGKDAEIVSRNQSCCGLLNLAPVKK